MPIKVLKKRRRKKDDMKPASEASIAGLRRKKLQREPVDLTRRSSERWNLEAQEGIDYAGLSPSSLGKWIDCREQFRLEKVEGFRSLSDGSPAIDFGELWHTLLARHYMGHPVRNLRAVLERYRKTYMRERPNVDERRRNALEISFLKTMAMWDAYHEKWAEEDSGRVYEHVEYEWSFEHEVPAWIVTRRELDRPVAVSFALRPACRVPFRGIYDLVFRDDAGLWVLDHKTKGRIDEWEMEDALGLNIQQMSYAYAVKQVFGEWPAGIVMNVIRNPGTEPSKRNHETPFEFVERLRGEVEKDEDHYFKRWEMPVKPADIEDWLERQFNPILEDVCNWAYDLAPNYVNPNALVGKFGKCDMFDLITKGDTTGLRRVKKPQPIERKSRGIDS